MASKVWIRECDAELFKEACRSARKSCEDVELSTHLRDILTGKLSNDGLLGKLKGMFTLGAVKVWQPQGAKFVRVSGNSMYSDGVILTPYSDVDVDYHLGTRTIDKRTELERIELLGPNDDFMAMFFRTYFHNAGVNRNPSVESDNRFLVYETEKQQRKAAKKIS